MSANSIPTVILDGCGSVAEQVSKFAPTAVFERSGGWRVEPRLAAAELHAWLAARKFAPPFILVGASYAAFTHLLFAFHRRQVVAGMILIDPSHPRQGEKALARLSSERVGSSMAIEQFRSFLSGFGADWDEGCRQVSEVTELGDVPLRVLAAGALEMPDELPLNVRTAIVRERNELLLEYCRLTSNGTMRVVEGVGHGIAAAAPDVVIESIRQMIVAHRA